MAKKYFIVPDRSSSSILQWDEDVGWSFFTSRSSTGTIYGIDGTSLDDIWVSTGTVYPAGSVQLDHWDGNSWSTSQIGTSTDEATVSLAQEDGAVYISFGIWNGYGYGAIIRLDNRNPASYTIIIDENLPDRQLGYKILVPINNNLCYWSLSYIGGGINLFRWTTSGGVEQAGIGSGLPSGENAVGLTYAVWDEELYIFFQNGDVYRGTWSGGFTLDNATDGPFPTAGSQALTSITSSKNDNFIVALGYDSGLGRSRLWVRNGPDNWTDFDPNINNANNPVALNENIFLVGQNSANNIRYSLDGGSSWLSYNASGNFGKSGHYWGYVVPGNPPVITAVSPIDSQTEVSVNSTIVLDIQDLDDEYNIDDDTIKILVEGNIAFENNSFVSPYDGTNSSFTNLSDGYRIEIDKTTSFVTYSDITVYAEAYGLADEFTTLSYSFRTEDIIDPVFDTEFPTDSSTGNSKSSLISITFYDADSDITQIDAYVNGTHIYDGSFTAPYNGPSSDLNTTTVDGYDGYQLVIDRTTDFSSGETVDVDIYLYDNEDNSSNFSWSFEIEDYVAPVVSNTSPTGGQIETNTTVSFDITDDFSGVNLSATTITIGTVAYNGSFISPFTGTITPISNGYNFSITNSNMYDTSTTYTVDIAGEDNYGNAYSDSFNFTTLSALSNVSLGQFEITIDVVFDTDMTQDSNLVNSANYNFNNGAYARKVDILSSNSVRLWVENYYKNANFTGDASFKLTLNNDITTLAGNPVSSVSYITLTPTPSTASFSHYNGLIRTYRDMDFVDTDSERIYLSGTKGIDVLYKQTATNYIRWAQILDAYGVDAMRVANYPSDYVFTDTAAPTISNQSPAPNSTAATNTHIIFSITDTTAPNVINTRIYVNGTLVFNGSEGWNANWSGNIEYKHKELEFDIYPRTPFTLGQTISVRVVSEDLLENISSITYSFSIG